MLDAQTVFCYRDNTIIIGRKNKKKKAVESASIEIARFDFQVSMSWKKNAAIRDHLGFSPLSIQLHFFAIIRAYNQKSGITNEKDKHLHNDGDFVPIGKHLGLRVLSSEQMRSPL